MRKFTSYGSIDIDIHYYAPRKKLIEEAFNQLLGENSEKGGHYITTWGPRQTGKTWIMQQIVGKFKKRDDFEVGIITMQSAKEETTDEGVLEVFINNLSDWFNRDFPKIDSWKNIAGIFTKKYFKQPLILIIDEFDALQEEFINKFANEFRDMYIRRQNEADKKSHEKKCLLHSLALIGIRSVLGIENIKGSPFNVQRSLHIPNLTFNEVDKMFKWYEQDSGQKVEQDVIDQLYNETQGQPGLTCWLGELLTEGWDDFQAEKDKPITIKNFEEAHAAAISILPNNNILNLISKVKEEPYNSKVIDLFKTDVRIDFKFDDIELNHLYMNGIIDRDKVGSTRYYVKFSNPFVQKRLFNYFSHELFSYMGKIVDPFDKFEDVFKNNDLNIRNLIKRYQVYLKKNKDWLLKEAPRRKDLRIFEAVFHFNLFMYLYSFFEPRKGLVHPEFPTGNGKIDILIKYDNRIYGIELKSFTDEPGYYKSLKQAADYGKQLNLKDISLVLFIDFIDKENRSKYEIDYIDKQSGVKVIPVFVETDC